MKDYILISQSQKRILLMITFIFIIGILVIVYRVHFNPQIPVEKTSLEQTPSTLSEKQIIVHLGGAVNDPGVYHLNHGARLIDVVEIAGGFLEEADIDKLNLAKLVKDEEKYNIPYNKIKKKNETSSFSAFSKNNKKFISQQQKISINTASLEELCVIPGIGKTTARKIIQLRQENSGFTKVNDLLQIRGIGSKKLEKIKPYIIL
jgi:competence protein ComEA